MNSKRTISVDAEPYVYEFEPAHCALVIIDMQRDFLEPGGFGEMLGNDVSQLRRTIEPNRKLLAAWRSEGLKVIHTREGHRSDMTDLPHVIAHAKSLFSNAVAQRIHKPLPRGFRILDTEGAEVARWSVDDS